AGEAPLLAEALDGIGGGREVRRDELDGGAASGRVHGLPDGAHAALAELPEQVVAAELSRVRGGAWGRFRRGEVRIGGGGVGRRMLLERSAAEGAERGTFGEDGDVPAAMGAGEQHGVDPENHSSESADFPGSFFIRRGNPRNPARSPET